MSEPKYRVLDKTVIGPGVALPFQEQKWAIIICNFLNGKYNAAKGMIGELNKKP